MIFVTVGTQFGFDRMVKYVDHWLGKNPQQEAFAQIAQGIYKPLNMPYHAYLDAEKYAEIFSKANVIVSHAGMGSILSALSHNKKIIVVPREYAFAEHRNDHQKDAIPWLREIQGVKLATDEQDLFHHLNNLQSATKVIKDDKDNHSHINYTKREQLQLAVYDLLKQHC